MALNQMFLFPFEKVKKGTRIVLYGMGNVGNCYYNQIRHTGYCEIVAIIDKYIYKEQELRYILFELSDLEKFTYDYIVLAVNSEGDASRIRHDLIMNYGIKEEKILYAAGRRIPIQLSKRNLDYIFRGFEELRGCFVEFISLNYGQMDYFSEISDEIRERPKEIKDYFDSYLSWEKNIMYKIICLRLMYQADIFDKECLSMYMDCIEQMEGKHEDKLWLLYDISAMEKNNQSLRKNNFYNRKRKLMEDVIFHFINLEKDKEIKTEERNNRVAIIAFGLRGKSSSHNGLIVPYANEMVRQGKQVRIFPCDLLRYKYGECFIEPLEILQQYSTVFANEHEELFDSQIQIQYVEGDTIKERIQQFVEDIKTFSPKVVYDFCGEYAFLSPIYWRMYPTVALPMRGYASSACFDKYVGRNKEICLKENEKFPYLDREGQLEGALVCSVPIEAKRRHTREEYGFSEDTFIITTVGVRLQTELTEEFVEAVVEFLLKNENAVWILVGSKICKYITSKYQALVQDSRIVFWGYEIDLPGFYGICDIYWNPNRMGSGGSIGTAMRCGLPVVMTDFPSDALPRVGIENVIHGDYNACYQEVEKLYSDKAYRLAIGEKMRQRMKISTISDYVKNLLRVGEEAYIERKKGCI